MVISSDRLQRLVKNYRAKIKLVENGEVKRLLKIGAVRHTQAYDPDDDFRVLEDPDGNLFCVVEKSGIDSDVQE